MNLFELFAVISLDNKGYKDSLNETESLTESVGSKIQSVLGKLVTLEAIEKAGSALVSFGKQSLEAYADYEQLAGGAELLWGDAYDFVADKAKNAYKTVQMSQNDYLQQMNGFSTGLKEALGGDEKLASELADKIITAEADVVSATGVSQEAVQNAFNGIMKSNYTMLDNLQLGITPTKEGMQEVIDKMNEWNKAQGNATNYQMGNLADMQSAIVDYVAYVGMSGYAQMEASETIQGSLAMTKSAWSNFLTALADPKQSVMEAMKGVYTSVQALASNVIPVIKEIAPAMVDGLSMIANLAIEQAPQLIGQLLPTLVSSIKGLVMKLIETLPAMLNMILDVIPDLLKSAGEMIVEGIPTLITALTEMIPILTESLSNIMLELAEGLPENLPVFIENLLSMVQTFASTLAENAPIILQAGITLIMALAQGFIQALPTIIEQLPTIITTFANIINDNAPTILKAGFDLLVALGKGLIDAIPTLIANIPQIIEAIVAVWEAFNWLQLGQNAITFMKNGITNMKGAIGEAGKSIFNTVENALKNLPNTLKNLGSNAIKGMSGGISGMASSIGSAVRSLLSSILSIFRSFSLVDVGRNIIQGLINGIISMGSQLFSSITGLMTNAISGAKKALGIASPSKVFKEIGEFVVDGFNNGIDTLDPEESMSGFNDLIGSVEDISTTSSGSSSGSGIYDLLAQYLPALSDQKIVLDTGALVGQTVGAYDQALGKLYNQQVRYV